MDKFDFLSGVYTDAKIVLAGTVSKGDYVAIGTSTHGFYVADGVSGDLATVITDCPKVKVVKVAGQAWVPGNPVYYHVANGNCTTTATGAILVGYAIEAAASADVVGYIAFDGNAAFLKA